MRAGRPIGQIVRGLVALALCAVAFASGGDVRAQDAGGGRITFQQVFDNPGDFDLNFAYANQQIEDGNLPGAASTLERLLILEPEAHQVRLLYAIILYRLGQTDEARVEFDAVDRAALSTGDEATLDRFLTLTARAQQATSGWVGVTGGLQYDTNRNAFPLGGVFQVELPNGSARLPGIGDENGDFGQFLLLDGRVDHDFGLQRIQRASIYGTGLGVNQVEESQLDVVSGLIGGSVLIDADVVDIEPSVNFLNVNLGGSQYLAATEGRIGFARAIGTDARYQVYGSVSGGYENFNGVEADPFAADQNGPFARADIGLLYTPTDRLQLTGFYRFTRSFAEADFEAFTANGLRFGGQYVVASGVSLSAFGGWTRQGFWAPDPFVSETTTRVDNLFDAGLGVVVSARSLLNYADIDPAGSAVDNLLLNVGGRYRRALSNLPNFEYDNLHFEMSITKRFFF